MFRAIPCVIACLVLFGAVHAREPVASSAHFVFFNDFEFNLHDAILAAGVERKFGREELFQSGDAKGVFRGTGAFRTVRVGPCRGVLRARNF